jgi:hypothetical protein
MGLDFSTRGQIVIRGTFIPDGVCRHNQMTHRDLRVENPAPPASDEFPATSRNDLFQEAAGKCRPDPGMKSRQPFSIKRQFIEGAFCIRPVVSGNDLRFPLFMEFLKHFLEECDHTVFRYVGGGDQFGGFDNCFRCRVVFKDRELFGLHIC